MKLKNTAGKFEFVFEEVIFHARWLLAPAYVLLAMSLGVLSYKTTEEFIQLVLNLHVFDEGHAILQVLTIVDLVLVLNLVLMVLFVGYTNFVSIIRPKKEEDIPRWMGDIDYAGLKLQLIGSVIAIASIKLLRTFLELSDLPGAPKDRLTWLVVLYAGFLAAALIIAIVNKLEIGTGYEFKKAIRHKTTHHGGSSAEAGTSRVDTVV